MGLDKKDFGAPGVRMEFYGVGPNFLAIRQRLLDGGVDTSAAREEMGILLNNTGIIGCNPFAQQSNGIFFDTRTQEAYLDLLSSLDEDCLPK
jgi:hypothetical protein